MTCATGERKAVLLVMLDLLAAFNTVDHGHMLQTLRELGVGGTSLQWFMSYLSDRTQYIKVKDAISSPCNLECGVSYGSVRGLILFTIYTSSLGILLRQRKANSHFYAADSQLYACFHLADTDKAIRRMESHVASVQACMTYH